MGCRHKFKPRYDREWTTTLADIIKRPNLKRFKLSEGCDSDIYLKKETYIYDICVKCGKTIKKED